MIFSKRIYKENKGIYGAPKIHHIFCIEGFKVSLKRVQKRMTELGLCAITVKIIDYYFLLIT
ncbi:MAG: transposase [Clostridium butyricum]|nr:transposase [Clostridium butyricum]